MTKYSKSCFSFIFFILFLSSCELFPDIFNIPDKTIKISGNITEIRTGKPVEGCTAGFWQTSLLGSRHLISEFKNISDASGYFEINFKPDYYNTFEVIFKRDEYQYYYYFDPNNISVKSGEIKSLEISAVPLRAFRLNILNEPPASATDSIYFCLDGEYMPDHLKGCLSCISECDKNIIGNLIIESNSTINLTWWVTENGITTPYSHDIDLVSVGTLEYTIRY